MELRRLQQGRTSYRTDTRRNFKFIRPDKKPEENYTKTLTEKHKRLENPPQRKPEETKSSSSTTKAFEDRKTSTYQSKSVDKDRQTTLRQLKLTVEERNPTNYKPNPSVERSKLLYRRPDSPEKVREQTPEKEKSFTNDSWETVVHTISETLKEEEDKEESREERRTEKKAVERRQTLIQQSKEDKKQSKNKERKEEHKEEERREKTWIKTEKEREVISSEDAWILPSDEKLSTTFPPDSFEEDIGNELDMPKIAFTDQDHSLDWSQRLNYMPHVILIVSLMTGTVFMLASVGSNQWMQAQVSGLSVNYGLFERCVTSPSIDVTICEPFDWPAWLYGTTQEKINAVKVLAIVSTFFSCVFTLGALLLLLTSACHKCHGWGRKAFFLVVDICLWLMVISAAVSSLLFLSGRHSVEAYPNSELLWPPVLYCSGWSMCLLARLLIAVCCDVHQQDGRNTMPFA